MTSRPPRAASSGAPQGAGPELASEWATNPPEPPWFSSPRKPRPQRRPLTRDEIVDAVLDLLDRQGERAVTMRALASRLDTSVASLYAHVDGKAELYRLALDRLFGKLEVPPPDPPRWRDQVREVVREARDLMGRHPDLAGMMLGHVMGGPNFVSFLERLLALLRAGGLPERVCVCGRELLGLLIGTYAVEDGLAPCGRDTEALLDYLGSLPGSRFPNTVALAGTRRRMRLEERFELGLDVILSGLASHAAARR